MAETKTSRYSRLRARAKAEGLLDGIEDWGPGSIDDGIVALAALLGMEEPGLALNLRFDLVALLRGEERMLD